MPAGERSLCSGLSLFTLHANTTNPAPPSTAALSYMARTALGHYVMLWLYGRGGQRWQWNYDSRSWALVSREKSWIKMPVWLWKRPAREEMDPRLLFWNPLLWESSFSPLTKLESCFTGLLGNDCEISSLHAPFVFGPGSLHLPHIQTHVLNDRYLI